MLIVYDTFAFGDAEELHDLDTEIVCVIRHKVVEICHVITELGQHVQLRQKVHEPMPIDRVTWSKEQHACPALGPDAHQAGGRIITSDETREDSLVHLNLVAL